MSVLKTRFWKSPWVELAVFGASVITTLLFWVALPASSQTNENSDYLNFYEPIARAIAEGQGPRHANGTPAVRYPPGFPVLLAGIFKVSSFLNVSEASVYSAFTLLCIGMASVFLFKLAQSLWGQRPALVSALLWITNPFALWLTKQPNSEIPFIVVFYGGFYLFWHSLLRRDCSWPIFFLSGLLAGLAMLIRPITIGIALPMGIILWLVRRETPARRRAFLAAMVLAGNLVVIFPWEAWIYSTTGKIIPLSTGGAVSIRDGLTFAVSSNGYREPVRVPQDVASVMADVASGSDQTSSVGDLISLIIDKLQTQPLAVTKLFALKAARSWFGTDSGRFETAIVLSQIVYLFLGLGGIAAAWRRGAIARQLALSVALIVLYFWGMTVLALSILRYMLPAMGLLFVFTPAFFVDRLFIDRLEEDHR